MFALVMAGVPRREGFRLAIRVVPFLVFDVVLFTKSPAMREVMNFGDESEEA